MGFFRLPQSALSPWHTHKIFNMPSFQMQQYHHVFLYLYLFMQIFIHKMAFTPKKTDKNAIYSPHIRVFDFRIKKCLKSLL